MSGTLPMQRVPPALRDCSILVVDDSHVHRKIITSYLRFGGFHRIATACNGQEALEAIRAAPPDLILLDLVMPVLDGLGVCDALRGQPAYKDIPVLIMTGIDNPEYRLRALSASATDVIIKPVSQPELVAHAVIHLERRMMIRGLREMQDRTDAERAIARQMQQALLPDEKTITQIRDRYGIDIAAVFEPSEGLGGDIWGVWPIDATRLGVFVGDVSGHGTIAAINTFRVHTLLTRSDFNRSEPGRFLSAVNDRLAGLLSPGQFVTMLYAVLDIGQNSLTYAAAGCCEPILALPNAPLRGLDGSGLPLGITAGVQYATRRTPFTAGTRLVLHSDALTEATLQSDGSLLGEERARAMVLDALHCADSQAMVSSLFQRLGAAAGPHLDDDLTLICIGRPEPASSGASATRRHARGRVLVFSAAQSAPAAVHAAATMLALEVEIAPDLAAAGRLLGQTHHDIVVVDRHGSADERIELLRTIAGVDSQLRLVLVGAPCEKTEWLCASMGLEVAATIPDLSAPAPLRDGLERALAMQAQTSGERWLAAITEADLARALQDNEITFSFQPQVALATRQVVGAEALARWISPQHGAVPTNVLLSLIANGGADALLAQATLRAAIAGCARWRRINPAMTVAVNVSAAALDAPALPDVIVTQLQAADLSPSALVIEIGEQDALANAARLQALADLGLGIALEEFANGDLSLRALQHMPFGMLKLGRLLVQRCVTDPHALRLLRAASAAGRAFGLPIAAVGAETEAIEARLKDAGCDIAQGWLYGPALSVPAIETLLRGHGSPLPPG